MKATNINEALLIAQRNIGAAVKGASNPFFKSKYADLGTVMEVVKKPLNDAGLSVTQELRVIRSVDGGALNTLVTVLRNTDGETIESAIIVPECKKIQDLGSAITYLKRYSLQALLFVPTEDDDGNFDTKKPKAVAAKPMTTTSF